MTINGTRGMKEAGFWQVVRRHLSPFGVLRRVENKLDLGTPDVAYCLRLPGAHDARSGWLELKRLHAWGRKNLVVPHLTIDQVINLEQWVLAGGRAHLLMAVADDVVLCNGAGGLDARYVYQRALCRADAASSGALLGSLREFPTRQLLEALAG